MSSEISYGELEPHFPLELFHAVHCALSSCTHESRAFATALAESEAIISKRHKYSRLPYNLLARERSAQKPHFQILR